MDTGQFGTDVRRVNQRAPRLFSRSDSMKAIRYFIAASIFCVAACSSGRESVVIVRLAPSDAAAVASAAAILGKRLVLVSGVDEESLRPVVSGTTVRYDVVLPPGSEELLHATLVAKGELEIAPSDGLGEPWLSDQDVAAADAYLSRGSSYVRVTAKPAAARRLVNLTTANVGRNLTMSWNGRALMTAPVLGPFGDGPVQFGPLSDEEAKVAALVLRTGRLPVSVIDATITAVSD